MDFFAAFFPDLTVFFSDFSVRRLCRAVCGFVTTGPAADCTNFAVTELEEACTKANHRNTAILDVWPKFSPEL